MKAIKVTAENHIAIAAALKAVNGKATAHTFNDDDILSLAERAEQELWELVARKSDMKGALVFATSGGPVAKSYKNKRVVTSIKLERRSTDWWLVAAHAREVFPDQKGGERMVLTPAQDARAVEVLRGKYSIAPQAKPSAANAIDAALN